MSTSEPVVRVAYPQEDCALVTLNRPEAKNALSSALRRELVRLFAKELPGRARVVVLTGTGGSFCAGLDLKELADSGGARELITGAELDVVGTMRAFDGPIIGASRAGAGNRAFRALGRAALFRRARDATPGRHATRPGAGRGALLHQTAAAPSLHPSHAKQGVAS